MALPAFRIFFAAITLTGLSFSWGQGVHGGGRKVVAVTALTGKGTWEDPRRPVLPVAGAVNYRWVPSDDGQWAIVALELGRVTAQGLKDFDDAAAGRSAAVKVFERGKDQKEAVAREVRKYKKDFDLEEFLAGKKAGGVK
jgi:hypothetical protein